LADARDALRNLPNNTQAALSRQYSDSEVAQSLIKKTDKMRRYLYEKIARYMKLFDLLAKELEERKEINVKEVALLRDKVTPIFGGFAKVYAKCKAPKLQFRGNYPLTTDKAQGALATDISKYICKHETKNPVRILCGEHDKIMKLIKILEGDRESHRGRALYKYIINWVGEKLKISRKSAIPVEPEPEPDALADEHLDRRPPLPSVKVPIDLGNPNGLVLNSVCKVEDLKEGQSAKGANVTIGSRVIEVDGKKVTTKADVFAAAAAADSNEDSVLFVFEQDLPEAEINLDKKEMLLRYNVDDQRIYGILDVEYSFRELIDLLLKPDTDKTNKYEVALFHPKWRRASKDQSRHYKPLKDEWFTLESLRDFVNVNHLVNYTQQDKKNIAVALKNRMDHKLGSPLVALITEDKIVSEFISFRDMAARLYGGDMNHEQIVFFLPAEVEGHARQQRDGKLKLVPRSGFAQKDWSQEIPRWRSLEEVKNMFPGLEGEKKVNEILVEGDSGEQSVDRLLVAAEELASKANLWKPNFVPDSESPEIQVDGEAQTPREELPDDHGAGEEAFLWTVVKKATARDGPEFWSKPLDKKLGQFQPGQEIKQWGVVEGALNTPTIIITHDPPHKLEEPHQPGKKYFVKMKDKGKTKKTLLEPA